MRQYYHCYIIKKYSSSLYPCGTYCHKPYYVAYCLDYTLYAVGHSTAEATAKLKEEIRDYILDFKDQARRAPAKCWLYYYMRCLIKNGTIKITNADLF